MLLTGRITSQSPQKRGFPNLNAIKCKGIKSFGVKWEVGSNEIHNSWQLLPAATEQVTERSISQARCSVRDTCKLS